MAQKHPNRLNFEGVMTRLDQPSDKPPGGSRGHCVILPREVAELALPTLLGMPVGFGNCWTKHNYQQRCGIIDSARIDGDELWVGGYLFARDFPDVVKMMASGRLGMSYEIADATVRDTREPIWTLGHVTFTGAALLFASSAAYSTTHVHLSAAAQAEECHLMPTAGWTLILAEQP